MSPTRLEAFSDGVLAIAATLLVLELRPPETEGHLLQALLDLWPTYAAYVTSFLTIGIIWVNHHSLFAHVIRVDRTLMFLNLLLLMVVSVIPFPTAILGRYVTSPEDSHVAAAVYGVVMVLMSISFSALWFHVTRDGRLIDQRLDPKRARRESLLFSVGLIAYIVAIGLAFISALLSLLVYALAAVFYVFPWLPEYRYRQPEKAGARLPKEIEGEDRS